MRAHLRALTLRRRQEFLPDGRKRRCMDLPLIWSTVKSVAPTSVGNLHRSKVSKLTSDSVAPTSVGHSHRSKMFDKISETMSERTFKTISKTVGPTSVGRLQRAKVSESVVPTSVGNLHRSKVFESSAQTSIAHLHRSIATCTCHSGERRNPGSARPNRTAVIAADPLRSRWLEDKFKAGLMS